MKIISKIIFIIFVLALGHCYAYDLGSMVPGTAGWDNQPQNIVEIAVNFDVTATEGDSWELYFSINDFNTNEFDANENVRVKLYYLGSALSGAWLHTTSANIDNDTVYLDMNQSKFDNALYPADPFISYDKGQMRIVSGEAPPPPNGRNVSLVIALAVMVPENGKNLVGHYASEVFFDGKDINITQVVKQ